MVNVSQPPCPRPDDLTHPAFPPFIPHSARCTSDTCCLSSRINKCMHILEHPFRPFSMHADKQLYAHISMPSPCACLMWSLPAQTSIRMHPGTLFMFHVQHICSPGHVVWCCKQGYAYILTHPGTPCIFWDHMFTEGVVRPSLWRRMKSLFHGKHRAAGGRSWALRPLRHVIVYLIKIRKSAGIRSTSQVRLTLAKL